MPLLNTRDGRDLPMLDRTNIYTQVSQELGAELARGKKEASESKTTPFGVELVTPETEAKRFHMMNPEGKKAYMKQHGVTKTLDVVRRAVKRGSA